MNRTALIITAALSGAGLLLTACSSTRPAPSAGAAGHFAPLARSAPSRVVGTESGSPASYAVARLPQPVSIIKTASLTIRAKDVAAAAAVATSDVSLVGGYVADEQDTTTPGGRGASEVSLQLKIPVARYAATLSQLAVLGRKISFSQQAQDVTQQVADVSSRVASATDAIRQLRALLSRAGSVGALLAVQDEINTQESSLEALLAQQRALAHETSYGTVSLVLFSQPVRAVKHHKKRSHGFGSGLRTGWHALGQVITGLLTALGAALPFIVPLALLGGIGYAGRRRLTRRRISPAKVPPPATP
jgi:hypothetical protein